MNTIALIRRPAALAGVVLAGLLAVGGCAHGPDRLKGANNRDQVRVIERDLGGPERADRRPRSTP